jgi:hypothetical protein
VVVVLAQKQTVLSTNKQEKGSLAGTFYEVAIGSKRHTIQQLEATTADAAQRLCQPVPFIASPTPSPSSSSSVTCPAPITCSPSGTTCPPPTTCAACPSSSSAVSSSSSSASSSDHSCPPCVATSTDQSTTPTITTTEKPDTSSTTNCNSDSSLTNTEPGVSYTVLGLVIALTLVLGVCFGATALFVCQRRRRRRRRNG